MVLKKCRLLEVAHDATCDGCEVHPIMGARHRCTSCTDFDLCTLCVSKDAHKPQHRFRVVPHLESMALSRSLYGAASLEDEKDRTKIIQLEGKSLEELKHIAHTRGIKVEGQGWAKCCPPDGNKIDIFHCIQAKLNGKPSTKIGPGIGKKPKCDKRGKPPIKVKTLTVMRNEVKVKIKRPVKKMMFESSGRAGFGLYSGLVWGVDGTLKPT